MKNWLRKKSIRWLVRDLFNTIDENDIINVKQSVNQLGQSRITGIYIRNRKLDQSEIDALKEGAIQIQDSAIWKLLSNEVRYLSNKQMYETGDVMSGQIALFVIKVIEKTIDKISKL